MKINSIKILKHHNNLFLGFCLINLILIMPVSVSALENDKYNSENGLHIALNEEKSKKSDEHAKGQGARKNKGPKPRGALHTSGGGVFDKGQYQATFRHIYMKQDQIYEGSSKKGYSKPGPYERETHNMNLAFRAGVFNNFDLRLAIPMSEKEMKRKTKKEDISQDSFNIGDIRLIGRYRLMSQKHGNMINLAIGAGIKMPTGETNKKEKGQTLPGFLQAGTGSWDPVFEVAAHKMAGRQRIGASLMYTMTTEGRRGGKDFEAPDDFRYNLAWVSALSKYFDFILELNGRYTTKAKVEGKKQKNSGGHTIHLTPGMNFKFNKSLHFTFGVPTIVYRDLNGRQLSEDYRISSKLVYKF